MSSTDVRREADLGGRLPALFADHLSKRYQRTLAVDDCTFAVRYGTVTGFLGPNGAGKTTTLKMMVELIRPSTGAALVAGRRFSHHSNPAQVLGCMFEGSGFFPGCNGRQHLRILAASIGVSNRRVETVLDMVGLGSVARKPIRKMSTGMRQRLKLAGTLLADPGILVLDEPTIGLDPEGIAWFRSFVKEQAASGKAVLVASHVLAEVAQTVDDVVIIAGGRLMAWGSIDEMQRMARRAIAVRCDQPAALIAHLQASGVPVTTDPASPDELLVENLDVQMLGDMARSLGVALYHIAEHVDRLEDVYLRVTAGQGLRPGPAADQRRPS